MTNIIIIDVINYSINYKEGNVKKQIIDILDDGGVEFKTVDEKEIMNYVKKELKVNDGEHISVGNLYETRDYIYIAYYVEGEDRSNKFIQQIMQENISSKMVIIKKELIYQINKNNISSSLGNSIIITENEFIDILEGKFIKNGVCLSVDGKMGDFKYMDHPLDHIMRTDRYNLSNFKYHEFEIYTTVLIIIVDKRLIDGEKNNIATSIVGKPVNGTVYFGLYNKPKFDEMPQYIDLTSEILDKILKIRSISKDITVGITGSFEEYINFYKLLDIEINRLKNKTPILPENISGVCLNSL